MKKLYPIVTAALIAASPLLLNADASFDCDFETDETVAIEKSSSSDEVSQDEAIVDENVGQNVPQEETASKAPSKSTSTSQVKAFTGKITKNKVRMRVQPTVDSPIVKELNAGDMVIVLGETDEFYAVEPQRDTKGYVFRTFVLDGVAQGTNINVRLEPSTDAPAIAQLSSGDVVNGTISQKNPKWLEIEAPKSVRFFVAKDYVENIGDASIMARTVKRQAEVNTLFEKATLESQTEMAKDFPDIKLDQVVADLNRVIREYPDYPTLVAKAKELLSVLQNDYLHKKVAYLESKANRTTQMLPQQDKLSDLQVQMQKAPSPLPKLSESNAMKGQSQGLTNAPSTTMSDKMAVWVPSENIFFNAWSQDESGQARASATQDSYYQHLKLTAVTIKGIIEPYTRIVKNKPGDYVIVNKTTQLPIAFLYSTRVNLQDYVGKEVTVIGSERPNNNFAYPAYFVLEIQ